MLLSGSSIIAAARGCKLDEQRQTWLLPAVGDYLGRLQKIAAKSPAKLCVGGLHFHADP
jgi:hypothetical protein